jgi:tetratricopeptide (TPR) repeat protein
MAADKERDPGASSAEIGKYLDILARDPNSRVFAPLAEAYRKAGFYDDAVETALEGLKVHPNYLGGRVALGRAYFEKKKYAEAAAEMQKVVKAAPDNIIAHKVLGLIADSQGDLPAAQKAFKMVLLLDPRDQEAQQFISGLAGGGPAAPAQVPVQPPPVAAAPSPPPPIPIPIPIPSPSASPLPLPTLPLPPPVALWPAAPPQAPLPIAPPAAAPLPFDEIQSIDDLDLQADDIFGAPDLPEPPAAPAMPKMPAMPEMRAEAVELQEIESEAPLDIAPDSWLPDLKSPAAPAAPDRQQITPEPAAVAPSRPSEPPPAASEGMELEVFSRIPWRAEAAGSVSIPSPPAPPAPPPLVAAEEPESPFEVFGRPMRAGPPKSTKGEQTAFGDIDLESTAYEAVQSEPEAESDSPFVMFTRQPGPTAPPAAAKVDHGEGGGARELEIETTGYTPSDAFASDDFDVPPMSLEEALPHAELTQEMDFGSPEDSLPSPASQEQEPEPEPEMGMDLGLGAELEVDFGSDLELDLGADEAAPLEPRSLETTAMPEPAAALSAAQSEALPGWEEPVREAPVDTLEEESVEEFEEVEPEEPSPGAAAGRGVFDTETLASIYVNQGFYARAAEIYQRLIVQRPEDLGLRRKLEDVQARERSEAGGSGEPAVAAAALVPPALAAPAESPVAPRAGSEMLIGQLQTLLETFKEGRPR